MSLSLATAQEFREFADSVTDGDTASVCSSSAEDRIVLNVQQAVTGNVVLTLTVRPQDRMRTVKKRIEEALDIPKVEQRLLVGQTVVANSLSMEEAGFSVAETAKVLLMKVSQPEPAIFLVERKSGETKVLQPLGEATYTEDDIEDYAEGLGMNLEEDGEFLYLAREGIQAPLSPPWRHCESVDGELFYFNFETGVSSWDHPNDEVVRERFLALKAQKKAAACAN
eukprot:TRINITY_DN22132_c0_g1_i1.p2 TRINITY_DN22132_c0_g1~~TRINITY_DN22132_c0_g1_i1.p2  ORF type:complete len:225 (-),score=56.11 TRINITY_DN22132_c0_g1_i1:109-783(-)